MKKFFFMAVMAVCSLAASAQTPAAGSITVTPKVGLNYSNITNSEDVDAMDSKVGFTVGAEALYMFNDMLGISGGVMYSQQGGKFDDNDVSYNIDYVNIPIMLNEYVYPGLAIKLGVQPGFKVSDKFSKDGFSATFKALELESLDISIPIGISYEFSNVVIDARYNWGVSDIYKSEHLKGHNSVFQITAGYRF